MSHPTEDDLAVARTAYQEGEERSFLHAGYFTLVTYVFVLLVGWLADAKMGATLVLSLPLALGATWLWKATRLRRASEKSFDSLYGPLQRAYLRRVMTALHDER